MSWQPIETAPDDESVLIAIERHDGGYFQRVAYHMDKRFYGHDSPYRIEYYPAGWQPLPESPEPPEQARRDAEEDIS